jgi:hypothetical protein
MGIRFYCPNGHKLHVKSFQAGKRGICPHCGTSMDIPLESTRGSRRSSRKSKQDRQDTSSPPKVPSSSDDAAQSTQTPDVPLPSAEIGLLITDDSPADLGVDWSAVEVEPAVAKAAVPKAAVPKTAVPKAASAPAVAIEPEATPPSPQDAKNDPLAEAPDAVWYVRSPTGDQFGPANREVMRTWIAEGRVSPDSLVWREGWRDWREAASIFPDLPGSNFVPGLQGILPQEPLEYHPATASSYAPLRKGPSGAKVGLIVAGVMLAVLVVVALILWLCL